MPSPWWSFRNQAKVFLRTWKPACWPQTSRLASGSARHILVSRDRWCFINLAPARVPAGRQECLRHVLPETVELAILRADHDAAGGDGGRGRQRGSSFEIPDFFAIGQVQYVEAPVV